MHRQACDPTTALLRHSRNAGTLSHSSCDNGTGYDPENEKKSLSSVIQDTILKTKKNLNKFKIQSYMIRS